MPLNTHSREPTLHHACSPSSRLPSQASAPLSSDANDDDACCPICLARFECARAAADLGSGSALTTACGHRFCAACLRTHLEKLERKTCPFCREKVTSQAPNVSLQQVIARLGMGTISEIALATPLNTELFAAPGSEDLLEACWQ